MNHSESQAIHRANHEVNPPSPRDAAGDDDFAVAIWLHFYVDKDGLQEACKQIKTNGQLGKHQSHGKRNKVCPGIHPTLCPRWPWHVPDTGWNPVLSQSSLPIHSWRNRSPWLGECAMEWKRWHCTWENYRFCWSSLDLSTKSLCCNSIRWHLCHHLLCWTKPVLRAEPNVGSTQRSSQLSCQRIY